MKHNIRINGEVKEIDCELGSGVFDKHGKEIFEGDIVKIGGVRDYYVDCQYGVFCIRNNKGDAIYALRELDECYCEIVGHVSVPHFKDTGRAWSPQLHDAYNRLLDACIARKSPEAVCEAALTVVQTAKADNRFDD